MRWPRLLSDSRLGIAVIGVGGAMALALLSAAMHSYRLVFEPLLQLALSFMVRSAGGGYQRYDASRYEFWAWMPLLLAVIWLATCLIAFISKPATDRRIDEALRERIEQRARGAPLEPD